MECRLCGLPTPTPPVRDGGHAFCCFGCSAVFRTFGEGVLAERAARVAAEPREQPVGAEAFLRVEGMHCSSCEILLERTATRVDGVLALSCSYATSTARVVYDPERITEEDLPAALSRAGYRLSLRGAAAAPRENALELLRVIVGIGFAGVVMMLYLAFFYPTDLGLVGPKDLQAVGWVAYEAAPRAMWVLTTLQVLLIGMPILRGAWIGLRAGAPNMDGLLALAILAAYGYSVGQLLSGSLDIYFDVATVIVAVVTTGRYFERGAKARATRELSAIIRAWAPQARVRRGDAVCELPASELLPGDTVLVAPGEPIPVDGTVVAGEGAVDESLMTGEPFPVGRAIGAAVLGGSVLVEGELEVAVGAKVESQMDRLARILWNVQSSTSGVQGLADRIARVFVPAVLVLALGVGAWLSLSGAHPAHALLAALATLIVSCPCTFGLAIPLTTANAVSAALRHGIIVTSADTFAKPTRIDIAAIDKTGTLSSGQMRVVEVLGDPEVAARAAAVERHSLHPIAEAIARLDERHTGSGFALHPGRGAEATVDGRRVAVGSRTLFAALGWEVPEPLAARAAAKTGRQGVVSYVGWEGRARGAIVTEDGSRPEWEQTVRRLREDKRVVLLTGAEHPSGYEEAVDEVYAGVPPEAKAAVVRRLRADGRVMMVGDGSNDAPALAAADLGVAFGAPTALAAEAADVVIPGERLERVFTALELIATTRRRVRQNIGWALLYNAVAIPLAVTGFLNPLFAALAMATSSLLVVWNSSRPLLDAPEAEPAPAGPPLPRVAAPV